MNKIVLKKQFSEKVFLFEIEAPLIAKSRKAGNFIILAILPTLKISVRWFVPEEVLALPQCCPLCVP